MNVKKIDTKGFLCPKPLIMLKDAMKEMQTGEKIEVLTDNETSHKNLVTFLRDQGVEPEVLKQGNVYSIRADVPSKDMTGVNPESYCSPGNSFNDYTICIKKTTMGDGDPELGRILMEAFINHLDQQETLPSHIIFYNEGVKLTTKDSPVLETLLELEKAGTRIIVCGTCIDFYELQKETGVGMISNMVVITEKLKNTGHVIYP